jgi:hypothetical protein
MYCNNFYCCYECYISCCYCDNCRDPEDYGFTHQFTLCDLISDLKNYIYRDQ